MAGGRFNELPAEWEYREPFAGSASVFLRLASSWPTGRAVWLNDARAGVACALAAVRDYPQELTAEVTRNWRPTQADRVSHRAYFWHTTDLEGVGPDSLRDDVVTAAVSCLFQCYFSYNASPRWFRASD